MTIPAQSAKYGNPVVCDSPVDSAYVPLQTSLPEYRFMNRIVGFSPEQVYACTGRRAKSGYYEMVAQAFPWSAATEVRLERFFSLGSVLFGVAAIVISIGVFFAGWVDRTHTGPGIFTIPILFSIGGVASLLGARRLRLVVQIEQRRLQWTAPSFSKGEQALRAHLVEIPGLRLEGNAAHSA